MDCFGIVCAPSFSIHILIILLFGWLHVVHIRMLTLTHTHPLGKKFSRTMRMKPLYIFEGTVSVIRSIRIEFGPYTFIGNKCIPDKKASDKLWKHCGNTGYGECVWTSY